MGVGTFVKRAVQPADAEHRTRSLAGDLVLIAVVISLVIFGLLILYSASADFSLRNYGSPSLMFNKQLLWLAIGLAAAFLCSRIDYHHWKRFVLPLMAVTIILLIGVLFTQDMRNGAVRTLIGGSVQPSELAKLATILYLSVWLYNKRELLTNMQLGLIPLAVILGGIGGLIYLQPDLSATITIFLLGGLLFFLVGGDLRQIILFGVVALVAGWLVVQISKTGQYRLASYLDGLKNPMKSSDHVLWSLEAIYNGQAFGVGFGNATTKLIGLPFAATDSIFAVVVEELGLFGAFLLVGMYGVILWRGLKIASEAPDLLGSVIAAGLTFWIVIEAAINMAMMVGLFPVAGNALPFISAGGSNLTCSLAAIGIILSISRQGGTRDVEEKHENDRRNDSASAHLRRWNRRRGLSGTRRP
jgi:cell division protein FtsW